MKSVQEELHKLWQTCMHLCIGTPGQGGGEGGIGSEKTVMLKPTNAPHVKRILNFREIIMRLKCLRMSIPYKKNGELL